MGLVGSFPIAELEKFPKGEKAEFLTCYLELSSGESATLSYLLEPSLVVEPPPAPTGLKYVTVLYNKHFSWKSSVELKLCSISKSY